MILQGSVEWHLQRIGKVTASRVADVVARTKTGWGASRANYAAELIAERLTGVAVGAVVAVTVGAGVGVTLGTTVDPHAARPSAVIAAQMMVVRFMSALPI